MIQPDENPALSLCSASVELAGYDQIVVREGLAAAVSCPE